MGKEKAVTKTVYSELKRAARISNPVLEVPSSVYEELKVLNISLGERAKVYTSGSADNFSIIFKFKKKK